MLKRFLLVCGELLMVFFLLALSSIAAEQEEVPLTYCPYHVSINSFTNAEKKVIRWEPCPYDLSPLLHTFEDLRRETASILQGQPTNTPQDLREKTAQALREQNRKVRHALSDEFKIRWEEKHGAEYGKKGFDLFSDINVMDRIVNERTRFMDVFIEKHLEFIKGYDLKLSSLNLPLQTHLDFLFNLATDLKRRLEAGEFDPPAEQAAEG